MVGPTHYKYCGGPEHPRPPMIDASGHCISVVSCEDVMWVLWMQDSS